MRDFVTTLLDAAGLLLVAAGVTGGAWQVLGAWSLCLAGAVVLTGSWLAAQPAGAVRLPKLHSRGDRA